MYKNAMQLSVHGQVSKNVFMLQEKVRTLRRHKKAFHCNAAKGFFDLVPLVGIELTTYR